MMVCFRGWDFGPRLAVDALRGLLAHSLSLTFAGAGPSIIALIVAWLNGRASPSSRLSCLPSFPRLRYFAVLTWPALASSALILRRLRRSPVLGLARYRRLAIITASGYVSHSGRRPSHRPSLSRFRSRACFSLAKRRAFSYSANAPATWSHHLAARIGG